MSSSRRPSSIELSIVMPCLNERETVARCVQKARRFLRENDVCGEVIVADNGSTDGSQEAARGAGARVVQVEEQGYGSALSGGIAAAKGEFVAMGDADDSYDFLSLGQFLSELREGADLVMGNRFAGGIETGAMPFLHRYLGNPSLSLIGRVLFGARIGDFHCGLRAFRKQAIAALGLSTSGMEFATEMVVKASLAGLDIREEPTTLREDGRSRPPHLRTWRDGWRHLRFMLLHSPRWLFIYPGMALVALGTCVGGWLLPGPRDIGFTTLDIHTLLYAAVTVLVGFQALVFGVLTQVFASNEGLLAKERRLRWLESPHTLEVAMVVGILLLVAGVTMSFLAVRLWSGLGYGPLNPSVILRIAIPGVLAVALGCEVVLAGFFLSVLGLGRIRKSPLSA